MEFQKSSQTSAIVLALALSASWVAPSRAQSATSQVQPDNTKVNKRDRNAGEVTADQQKENASDRDLTKNIRRSIMADKGLSTYAHNIKVIVRDGVVSAWGLDQAREERGLSRREVLRRLVEIGLGGGADAVRAVAEVEAVQVHREDLVFREPLLDLHGQEDLVDLPGERLFGGQEDGAGELLLGTQRAEATCRRRARRRAQTRSGTDSPARGSDETPPPARCHPPMRR